MAKMGKKLKAAYSRVEEDKSYALNDAVAIIKETAAGRKFDETIDVAMNLDVDSRHADQMVRGVTALPNGLGKEVRVAVFAKGDKAEEARKAGADIVGDDDLVEKVQKGEINFDRCISTPDMMGKVGTLGRVLGPKGLMPNPKLGSVTMDIVSAVKAAKGGQVEFKVEKNGIIHAGVGKASFDQKAIVENVKAFVKAVVQAKPSGVKGTYIKKISVSSTMGPGIKLELEGLLN